MTCLGRLTPAISLKKRPHNQLSRQPNRTAAATIHLLPRTENTPRPKTHHANGNAMTVSATSRLMSEAKKVKRGVDAILAAKTSLKQRKRKEVLPLKSKMSAQMKKKSTLSSTLLATMMYSRERTMSWLLRVPGFLPI